MHRHVRLEIEEVFELERAVLADITVVDDDVDLLRVLVPVLPSTPAPAPGGSDAELEQDGTRQSNMEHVGGTWTR